MKTSSIAILAALSLTACGPVDTASTSSNQPSASQSAGKTGWSINPRGDLNGLFDCLEENGSTLVSAHRGGAYPGYPENAIETIDHVLSKAPAIMEIDVATSEDGVLYLMHDDTLDRTTTGSGRADSKKWSYISGLRLEDGSGRATSFAPSSFADTLAYAEGRTILQIDFKQSTRFEDVVDEVKRQDADDRVIYIAYSMGAARKLHRLHPQAMVSLSVNSQSELNSAVAAGIPANRLLGFTGIEDPRPRLFNLLNNRDVEVIFGTLGGRRAIDKEIARTGDESRYADLAKQGVDILATDRPIEAQKALVSGDVAPTEGVCGIKKV